jgi:hypothetical protein
MAFTQADVLYGGGVVDGDIYTMMARTRRFLPQTREIEFSHCLDWWQSLVQQERMWNMRLTTNRVLEQKNLSLLCYSGYLREPSALRLLSLIPDWTQWTFDDTYCK